ncbi:hypothetical protein LMG27174_06025 [Paraburkholderia rhynchosiae]|uniref:Uncharacterized protein n=1 Tax=Paraburkholderia rhynchosiae TaxID=487049 RepID=A0A6J5CC91_9BURK|nr:hypothetical protein LMG27174_06025 [Paraburkholderia rhynchosiae]
MRYDGPDHPYHAEEVGVEDSLGLRNRTLFRAGWSDSEASVVDQQVDAALQLDQLLDQSIDRRVLGHIERQHLERSLAHSAAAPAGAVYLVTSF